jgi:amino acid transporter
VIFGLWKFSISKGHNIISILLIFSCYVDVHAHVACRVEMKILVFAFSRKLIIAPREKFHTKIDENYKKNFPKVFAKIEKVKQAIFT